jgi:hypothetical protein
MTQNRDELKEKIAEAIRDGRAYEATSSDIAETVLSAIEQSGCTICPNEPTEGMKRAGHEMMPVETVYWIEDGKIHERFKAPHECVLPEKPYKAMLSSSPFNTPIVDADFVNRCSDDLRASLDRFEEAQRADTDPST